MHVQPIIIFDSGIGGLSILTHLKDYSIPLLYFADQANFPYGDKSEAWVSNRLLELSDSFSELDPLAVVVACNTGTVAGIEFMRKKLNCPVFGVEPVVKMLSHHKYPYVWGTKVTVSSAKAELLKNEYGEHVKYYTPEGLATAVEYDDRLAIKKILETARTNCQPVDAIGLSCTHYPLIAPMIADTFPNVRIYDPANAVVAHIVQKLSLKKLSAGVRPDITYRSTSDMLRLKKMAAKYL